MQRRLSRLGKCNLFVATLAAAMVVPYPVIGRCATAGDNDCCNSNRTASAGTKNCCRHPDPADIGATKSCDCRQPIDPQTMPRERTIVPNAPDYAVAVPAIAWSPADTHVGVDSQAALSSQRAAIPHRILHCTWLI